MRRLAVFGPCSSLVNDVAVAAKSAGEARRWTRQISVVLVHTFAGTQERVSCNCVTPKGRKHCSMVVHFAECHSPSHGLAPIDDAVMRRTAFRVILRS